MPYESGMQVMFDIFTKSAVVVFRDKTTILPGPFAHTQDAIAAGEAHCRAAGWIDVPTVAV